MASREEQKRIKREERLAREEAERRAAARRKRLQVVFGGVLAVAAVAAVAVALVTVIGGGDSAAGPRQVTTQAGLPKLPEPKITDVREAAKAAGCQLTNAKFEGQNHEDRNFTPADYKTNPPASGNHAPNWYEDGIYEPGNAPDIGQQVHTLEHGRVDIQYRGGTPKPKRDQLEALVGENEGYHLLLYENSTKMPYEVAATAWTQVLGCRTLNAKTFDALRTFRDEYLDKGPEKIP